MQPEKGPVDAESLNAIVLTRTCQNTTGMLAVNEVRFKVNHSLRELCETGAAT